MPASLNHLDRMNRPMLRRNDERPTLRRAHAFIPATAVAALLLFGGCQQVVAGSGEELKLAQAAGGTQQAATVAAASSGSAPADDLAAVKAIPSATGAYLAGRRALSARDMRAAAQFFDLARAVSPKSPEVIKRAFIAHLGAGDIAAASALAAQLPKDDSQGIAPLVMAATALNAGAFDKARSAVGEMANSGLGKLVAPLVVAWAEAGGKRVDAGLKALDGLKGVAEVAPLYFMHRALILDFAGRTEEAAKAYGEMETRQDRLSLRFAEMVTNFHLRQGDRAKAGAVLAGYRKQNPDSLLIDAVADAANTSERPTRIVGSPAHGVAEALFDIASLLHQERATDQAQLYTQVALYLRPQHTATRMLLGEILEAQQRPDEAITVYRAIEPQSPFYWSARLRVADNLEELKRDEEAVDLLEHMAGERPDRYDALTRKGNLLRGRERFAEAARAYDRAIERIPAIEGRHWSLLYSRGIALERSKQWQRAEGDFLKALELEPNQPYVLNYLGYSWVEQGINLDKAKDMIRRAVEQRPNDGYIVDSLGWVLYRLGDFSGSVNHLERAVELRPQDPVINDHLGDAYWRVDRRTEADFQWKRALGLEPETDLRKQIENKLGRSTGPAPTSVVQTKN